MKVKQLIEILSDCDQEATVILYELSEIYDTLLLSIDDTEKEVVFNIKTYIKSKEDKDKVH